MMLGREVRDCFACDFFEVFKSKIVLECFDFKNYFPSSFSSYSISSSYEIEQ